MNHTVSWTNEQVMAAYNEVQRFKQANRMGPVGYKAAQVRRALASTVESITELATELVGRYQKVQPNPEGGDPVRIPSMQDGRPVPLPVWCTSPTEYQKEDTALMRVRQEIHIPVRFTLAELSGLQDVRGEFFDALFDLIDAPATPQPTPAALSPTVPTIPSP